MASNTIQLRHGYMKNFFKKTYTLNYNNGEILINEYEPTYKINIDYYLKINNLLVRYITVIFKVTI